MDRYIINRRSPATPSPSNPNPSRATALERKPGWLEDLAKEIARKQRAKQGGPGDADLASQSEHMATVELHPAVFKPEADLNTTGLPKSADPEPQESLPLPDSQESEGSPVHAEAQLSAPSQPAVNSMTPATEESDKPGLLHNYEVIGIYLGSKPEYKKTFRYDARKKGWFEWYDNTWVNLDEKIPSELVYFVQHRQPQIDQELETLSSTTTKHTAAGPTETRDFRFDKKTWDHFPKAISGGLTRSLTRNFPDYEIDSNAKELRRRYLAVPSGVVDLKTGEMNPHNPLIHDTQAITTGDYRPRDADYLAHVLRARFLLILDDQEYEKFLELFGMTISGRGQSYKPIIFLYGPSGTGKGGTNRLLITAAGRRGRTLPKAMIEKSAASIDSDRYCVMRDQPLILGVDEASNVKPDTDALLSLTGDNLLPGARLPFMRYTISDTIPSILWWSCVDIPAINVGTGIDRRIARINFLHKIEEREKDARQSYDKDLLDAVITIGIQRAIPVWADGYTPPQFDLEDNREFLDDMDQVMAFINHNAGRYSDCTGGPQPVSNFFQAYLSETKDRVMTLPVFSKKVNKSESWKTLRVTSGENRGQYLIVRKG